MISLLFVSYPTVLIKGHLFIPLWICKKTDLVYNSWNSLWYLEYVMNDHVYDTWKTWHLIMFMIFGICDDWSCLWYLEYARNDHVYETWNMWRLIMFMILGIWRLIMIITWKMWRLIMFLILGICNDWSCLWNIFYLDFVTTDPVYETFCTWNMKQHLC